MWAWDPDTGVWKHMVEVRDEIFTRAWFPGVCVYAFVGFVDVSGWIAGYMGGWLDENKDGRMDGGLGGWMAGGTIAKRKFLTSVCAVELRDGE